jgi:hypothetical protein
MVENYSSALEFIVGIKFPAYVKAIIRSDIINAYNTNNFEEIQTINTCIATLPQLRSMDEKTLKRWLSQVQPSFLQSLKEGYEIYPLSKALLDLYSNSQLNSSTSTQNFQGQTNSEMEKEKTMKYVPADNYSIEGLWSKKEGGSSQPINSSSFVFGIYHFYQSYKFVQDGTFEQTITSKTTTTGNKDSVTKGRFEIRGDQIRMVSPEDIMLFRFKITNQGKTLILEALDDYSRAFSGEFSKEK